MNLLLSIKLIIRNWWRNKLYFFISLFSLTIGLACTSLLVTFFIHEYNIESTNPNRENIYILRQDSPMEEGEKVTYITTDAANQIKNNIVRDNVLLLYLTTLLLSFLSPTFLFLHFSKYYHFCQIPENEFLVRWKKRGNLTFFCFSFGGWGGQ